MPSGKEFTKRNTHMERIEQFGNPDDVAFSKLKFLF